MNLFRGKLLFVFIMLINAIFLGSCSSDEEPVENERGPLIEFGKIAPHISMDISHPAGTFFSVLVDDAGNSDVISLEVKLDGSQLLPFEFFASGLTPGSNPIIYSSPYLVSEILGFTLPDDPGMYTYSFIATDINNHTDELMLTITAE